ncbi:MAG: response regulator transcription factor [Blastocatellia bacterium]
MPKILIVDDNARMRGMLKAMVADLATGVIECQDGKDALAAYEANHPDVVLMDISMKEMDGLAATQQIVTADPAARIIIVTNFDDDAMRQAAQAVGARGYILKENLLEVRQHLQALAT